MDVESGEVEVFELLKVRNEVAAQSFYQKSRPSRGVLKTSHNSLSRLSNRL
jgi:hypothetical protein